MPDGSTQVSPNTGNATDEQVQIAKAELEGYKAAKEFYDSVGRKAKDIQGDDATPEAYVQAVEEEALEAINLRDEVTKLKGTPAPKAPEVKPNGGTQPPTPAPVALSDEDKALLQRSNQSASMALLEAQFTRFTISQKDLPEAERSKFKKDDLMKVIAGPKRGLVNELLADPQFDGNAFEIANYLLNEKVEREQRAKETKDRNVAIEKAKGAANINPSTVSPPAPDTKKTENQKMADEIAPDDPPVVLT